MAWLVLCWFHLLLYTAARGGSGRGEEVQVEGAGKRYIESRLGPSILNPQSSTLQFVLILTRLSAGIRGDPKLPANEVLIPPPQHRSLGGHPAPGSAPGRRGRLSNLLGGHGTVLQQLLPAGLPRHRPILQIRLASCPFSARCVSTDRAARKRRAVLVRPEAAVRVLRAVHARPGPLHAYADRDRVQVGRHDLQERDADGRSVQPQEDVHYLCLRRVLWKLDD